MSVSNGQAANQNTFNTAFVSRTQAQTVSGEKNFLDDIVVGDATPGYTPLGGGKSAYVADASDENVVGVRAEGASSTVDGVFSAYGGGSGILDALYQGSVTDHPVVLYSNSSTGSFAIREGDGRVVAGLNISSGGSLPSATDAVFSVVANSGDSYDGFRVVDESNTTLFAVDKDGRVTNVDGSIPSYTPVNHGVVISGASNQANVTSPGTVGQVLTSNGAGADPTFQTPPAATLDAGSVLFIQVFS